MAYETSNPMGGGDPMAGEGGGMAEGGGDTVQLGPELTGNQKFKAGDVLELEATADTDESGMTTFKYHTEGKGGGMSWEDEARMAMSPRKGGEEAM